jgi:thioredoxin reductase (NADPH)
MREVDVAIIGAGVAGLSAAAVAARAGLAVLVIERLGAGGQVMTVDRIDNYPGHPQGLSGYELGPMLQEEAENAGADLMLADVETLQPGLKRHLLHCGTDIVAARAVLVACGSRRRALDVPGEEAFEGRGVSHCASCDGPMYVGKAVCVAGGGDSAIGEALVLAPHAARVSVIYPEPEPHAQPYLLEGLRNWPNVELIAGARVVSVVGDASGVTSVTLQSVDGPTRELPAHGVFVYAGLVPATEFLAGAVRLDAAGRIETDARLRSSAAGIYAAGDVRSGAECLLAAAAADGAAAARSMVEDLR